MLTPDSSATLPPRGTLPVVDPDIDPHGDIAKTGPLVIRRDRVEKERYGVLWSESSDGQRKARLELYNDRQQFCKKKPPKKVYSTADMTTAVEEATDGLSSFVVVLRSHNEKALRLVAKGERDRQEWLCLLQEFINRTPSATRLGYDRIWHNLELLPLELGAASGLATEEVNCSFAFNSLEVALIRPAKHKPFFTCNIKFFRSCGSRDNRVSLSCGRRAPFGVGRLYLAASSVAIAKDIRGSLHGEMVRGAKSFDEPASLPVPEIRTTARSPPPFAGRSLPPTPDVSISTLPPQLLSAPTLPPGNPISRQREHGHTINLGQLGTERDRQAELSKSASSLSTLSQQHRPRALASSYNEKPAFLRQFSEPMKRSHTMHVKSPSGSEPGLGSARDSFSTLSIASTGSSGSGFTIPSATHSESSHLNVDRSSVEVTPDTSPLATRNKRHGVNYENVSFGLLNEASDGEDELTRSSCCPRPLSGERRYPMNHTPQARSTSNAIPISGRGSTTPAVYQEITDMSFDQSTSLACSRKDSELFEMDADDASFSAETHLNGKPMGSNTKVRGDTLESMDSGYAELADGKQKGTVPASICYQQVSFSDVTTVVSHMTPPSRSEQRTTYDSIDITQTEALNAALREKQVSGPSLRITA